MLNAITQTVTVQRDGRIEVFVPELPEGTAAEVTVQASRLATPNPHKRSLANLIGQGKGAFANAEEVDRFMRAERDQWR